MFGQNLRAGSSQTLVHFDAADFAEVETPAVVEVVQHEGAGSVHLHRGFAGAQPLVQVPLGQADAIRLLAVELAVGVHTVPQ